MFVKKRNITVFTWKSAAFNSYHGKKKWKKKLIITRIKKNEDINISYEFTD